MARQSISPASRPGPGGFISMRVDDRALARLQDKFDRWEEDVDEELFEEMTDELYQIKEESQAIVPYDTGKLHDSAAVEVRMMSGGQMAGEVTYSTEYAVYVHENPDAHHAPPTRFKFLEEVWNRRRGGMVRAIGQRVKKLLRES